MFNVELLSAFLIGVLGSGHCLGMCGGITTMLTSAIDPSSHRQLKRWLVVFYHIGRISSYTFIGAIVAFSSSLLIKGFGVPLIVLNTISALFLIALGLYLGQWLMWLTQVERLGKVLWRYLAPLSKKVIPVNNKRKAFGLGLLCGWLPCGLVYSTLTWALASGNTLSGGLIMLFFGLGTLPALLSLSFSIHAFKRLLVHPIFKKTSALFLIFFGFYQLFIAYL